MRMLPAKDSVLDHGEPSRQSSIRRRTRVDMMRSKLGVSMLSPPRMKGRVWFSGNCGFQRCAGKVTKILQILD